jgi:biotin carboxyl carrier protein
VKFKIHLDGAEHEIEATADGRLVLDGEVLQAKVNNLSDDRRMVQVGEKTFEVRVVEDCADTGIAVLELAGERISMAVTDVVKGASAASGGGAVGAAPVAAPERVAPGPQSGAEDAGGAAARVAEDVKDGIWAPVPGKIIGVFVKAGDVVEEGAALLVLEAMKMENELRAPHKATVAAVLVKKGDQAEKGQLLVAFA